MSVIFSYLVLGAVFGTIYFYLLGRMVAFHITREPANWLIVSAGARFVVAAGVFWCVVRFGGALPLLMFLVGFLVGRLIIQHAAVSR